jgi:hypothetical protein
MQAPFAIILCKLTDSDTEPFPKQHYVKLFTLEGGDEWNLARYFADWSHGTLDLSGTQVFGWYSLDKSVADYNALEKKARPTLVKWAREAAQADGVDLSPYYSVVVCTNVGMDFGSASYADGTPIGAVYQGPINSTDVGHEMAHQLGLEHSRKDGSDEDYQDPWDLMSVKNVHATPHPEFVHIGPGINAHNMRSRGWLDESRVWKNGGSAFDETVTLRPLVEHGLPGYLAAEIPGGFLAEFRTPQGWDNGIPLASVLIHRFANKASYLMEGNNGKPDLVKGSSFGSPEPDPQAWLDPFHGHLRVDVLSISIAAQEAVIRIRYHAAIRMDYRAVDLMSMLLPTSAYLRLLELHHPHVPRVEDIREALRVLTPQEQAAALSRARALVAYGTAVEEAFRGLAETAPRLG